MVVTLLVKLDDATMSIGLQTAEGVTTLNIRLHVPCAVVQPVVVVAPSVHHAVEPYRDVVDHTVEGYLAVDIEYCFVYAVVVIGALHIIVGPYGKADGTPSCQLRFET